MSKQKILKLETNPILISGAYYSSGINILYSYLEHLEQALHFEEVYNELAESIMYQINIIESAIKAFEFSLVDVLISNGEKRDS